MIPIKKRQPQIVHPLKEIDLGNYGGTECFFADINGDGQPEIIAYQGPGVFGARMFRVHPRIQALYPRRQCVAAFTFEGQRLWAWGEPNPPDRPYISHAYESSVATGDMDMDGCTEVAIALGDRVVVLEGSTGREKMSCSLPEDFFYQVQILDESTTTREAALVVKNGEYGDYSDPSLRQQQLNSSDYKPYQGAWDYGQPLIGLNAKLQTVWGPQTLPGAGHHILCLDIDGDRRKEYLVGYGAVHPDGKTAWIVNGIDPSRLDAVSQHVDYTDILAGNDGRKIFALAGSDRVFLVDNDGQIIMAKPDLHVQGAALGRFNGGDEYVAAFYNAPNGPMVLYRLTGELIGRRPVQRHWPFEVPEICRSGRFHRNRPIVKVPGSEQDWIGYADGGWPWGMNGAGDRDLIFEPPTHSCLPGYGKHSCDGIRMDDIGYGFALKIITLQGCPCAVIYNRRYVWVYQPG